MRNNQPVTNRNVSLPDNTNILSTTDTDSRITYINPDFIKISGFTEEELIGQPHNMVRHPDMPETAFQHMWKTLKSGKSWMGAIKNRCKNGDHYWVNAYVTPIVKDGKTVEYQSVRTKPSDNDVKTAEKIYANIRAGKSFIPKWRIPSVKVKVGLQLILSSVFSLFIASLLTDLSLNSALVTGVVSIVCGLPLLLRTLSPLNKLVEKAETIVDNPLSQAVYTRRHDEFGKIEFALRMAESETSAVIGRIGDSAQQLESCITNLQNAIVTTYEQSVTQQEETDKIAISINEITTSIEEVSGNAHNAAEVVESVNKDTVSGMELMKKTSSAIHDLELEIQEAATVIQMLEKRSVDISQVMDAISDVADQTNLLALNAAIEAARAGEQGRGFAVVADEVRNLAARTQESTMDTQEMISAIQEGARSAVKVMNTSQEQTQRCVAMAEQASDALSNIQSQIASITNMNTQIAAAVEQQSAVCNEINIGTESVKTKASANVNLGEINQNQANHAGRLTNTLYELALQFWVRRS